jgi:hypothetical protein
MDVKLTVFPGLSLHKKLLYLDVFYVLLFESNRVGRTGRQTAGWPFGCHIFVAEAGCCFTVWSRHSVARANEKLAERGPDS